MTGQGWGRWQRGVVDPRWENSPDQKYIVFRRGQLAALMVPNMKARINDLEDIAIYDAVVIRTQDVISGPVLHTYAANIALVAKILESVDAEKAEQLANIADYFHFRALEADDGSQKLPDF
jgi:hypothetical protein